MPVTVGRIVVVVVVAVVVLWLVVAVVAAVVNFDSAETSDYQSVTGHLT